MKNHEMMIRDIHRKMDAYNLKNEKRKEMTQKITKLTVPVCAAAFIGVGLLYKGIVSPEQVPTAKSSLNEQTELSSAAQNTETSVKMETTKQPEASNHTGKTESGTFVSGTEGHNPVLGPDCYETSLIYWNGKEYYDSLLGYPLANSLDRCLGQVSDFDGIYGETSDPLRLRRISPEDSVYSVKDTTDILLVMKPDGYAVVMQTQDWKPEKDEDVPLDMALVFF